MFTGIIDHLGEIIDIQAGQAGICITFASRFQDLKIGESIAINGICLTVVKIQNNCFTVDVSPETLTITAAKSWQIGSFVNLERALAATDRFGGHIVLGHVDRVARLVDKQIEGEYWRLTIAGFNKDELFYLVKKGSVCIDGISLTINEVDHNCFSVMIIPHTMHVTNLQFLNIGIDVNIEFDYLARVTVNWLQQTKS